MVAEKTLYKMLTVIIIIALTLILGYLIYINVGNMIINNNQQPELSIEAQIIINPSTGQTYLEYSLENNGHVEVEITNILVANSSFVQNIILNPGDVYQNVIMLQNVSIQPGVPVIVSFQGIIVPTDKQFSSQVTVIPET